MVRALTHAVSCGQCTRCSCASATLTRAKPCASDTISKSKMISRRQGGGDAANKDSALIYRMEIIRIHTRQNRTIA